MNHRYLAVWLWLLAWAALAVAAVLVLNGARERGARWNAAAGTITALASASVLINAGVDLW